MSAHTRAMRNRRVAWPVVLVVVALRVFADAVAGPLDAIVRFNDRNAGWLTVMFVALTVLWLALSRRRQAQ